MKKTQLPNKIRYEYQEEKNLSMQYAHGVWGGINPQGEIEINFYAEQDKIPLHSERYLRQDGTFGAEMTYLEDDMRVIQRKINAKVLLSAQTAKAFLNWLTEKVELLENSGDPEQFGIEENNTEREQ